MKLNPYELEARRAENENGDYFEFLKMKSAEKSSKIESYEAKDINRFLKGFVSKGYISDKEFEYLKSRLGKEPKTDREVSIDDIELRAEYISTYNVRRQKALEIARSATDEMINRVSSELPRQFGNELTNLLISSNPEIFLMDEKDFLRYVTKLANLVNLTKKYLSVNDFDPMKAPQNFASLDALKNTRRILYNMIGTVVLNGSNIGENGETEINEIDRIKLQLAREGFEPETALAIIQYGFYRHGKYFFGAYRLPRQHIENNTRSADIDYDPRLFDREFRKIMRTNTILYNKSTYSLNPHTNGIQSEALKNAINYVGQHHPKE